MKKNRSPIPAVVLIKDYRQSQTPQSQHPIKLRIFYLAKRDYLDLGCKCTEDEFNTKINVVSPPKAFRDTHKRVFDALQKAKDIIKAFEEEGLPFSFKAFEARYTGRPEDGNDLHSLCETKFQALKSDQWKTANQYRLAALSLATYHKLPVTFAVCTVEFLRNWEKWMLAGADDAEKKRKRIKPRSKATIGMYARCIQNVWNTAKDKGIVKPSAYPFGADNDKYTIPTGKNEPKPLTPKDVYDLVQYAAPDRWENWAKHFWLLSFYCNGMNPKDICLLKWKQIKQDRFTFERAKTIRTLKNPLVGTVILSQFAWSVIEAFGNEDKDPENYVFPMLNDRFYRFDAKDQIRVKVKPDEMDRRISNLVDNFSSYITKGIRRIWEKMEKDNAPRFYDARDSFASIMRDAGVEPLFIQESLLHTRFETTQNYLAKFPDQKKRAVANVLHNIIEGAAPEKKAV